MKTHIIASVQGANTEANYIGFHIMNGNIVQCANNPACCNITTTTTKVQILFCINSGGQEYGINMNV